MKGCPEKDRPPVPKFVASASTVKLGDIVTFTTMARSWTRLCTFRVLRVHSWGVLAVCVGEPEGVFTSKSVKGLDYKGAWEEIAEVVPPGPAVAAHPVFNRSKSRKS